MKKIANLENLVSNEKRTPEERRENAKKAGKASAKARREKRTIQKLANELFSAPCKENPAFEKLAKQLKLETDKSIKELFVLICSINTLKKGTLVDLQKLMEILGEDEKNDDMEKKLAKKIVEVFANAE